MKTSSANKLSRMNGFSYTVGHNTVKKQRFLYINILSEKNIYC